MYYKDLHGSIARVSVPDIYLLLWPTIPQKHSNGLINHFIQMFYMLNISGASC